MPLADYDPGYCEPIDTSSVISESYDTSSADDEPKWLVPDSLNKTVIPTLQQMNPGVIYTVLKLKNDVEYIHPENLAVVAEEDNKRVILPDHLWLMAFNAANQVLHLGIYKSILAVTKDYWWTSKRMWSIGKDHV